MSERSRRFYENWIKRLERLKRKKILSQSKDSYKSQAQSTETINEYPKNEIVNSGDNINHPQDTVEEEDMDGCIASEEIDANTEQICNILERLEKIEKTLPDIQESLEDESKKRETLGCAVIICGGFLFILMLCGIQAFWLAGMVFLGTLVGASLYATR